MNSLKPSSAITAGFIFAIGSAALFAIRPIFVKLVYIEGISPLVLIALRMLFSVPIYILILGFLLRKSENRDKLNLPIILRIAVAGLFGYYAASFLDLLGLQYVSSQLGRMILYSYPTFVVILSAIFLAQKITLRTIVSMFITYTGVALISGYEISELGSNVWLGGAFITGSAITFAIYLVLSKSLIDEVGSQILATKVFCLLR